LAKPADGKQQQILRGAFSDADEEALVTIEVTKDDIEDVIARWTGIPITSLKEEETQKLLRIELELHRRVVSQRPAISALARAIRRSRAG
jgi:ATP-dependent Clp protease ATP-binding subunit ClpC